MLLNLMVWLSNDAMSSISTVTTVPLMSVALARAASKMGFANTDVRPIGAATVATRLCCCEIACVKGRDILLSYGQRRTHLLRCANHIVLKKDSIPSLDRSDAVNNEPSRKSSQKVYMGTSENNPLCLGRPG